MVKKSVGSEAIQLIEIYKKTVKHRKGRHLRELDIYDRAILESMWKAQRKLTTKQIAERLGITWKTAKNHLKDLEKKKLITHDEMSNKTYWSL